MAASIFQAGVTSAKDSKVDCFHLDSCRYQPCDLIQPNQRLYFWNGAKFDTEKEEHKEFIRLVIMTPTRAQVLQLYRALLQYGRTLQLTDQEYFYQRVRGEFEKNRGIVSEKEKNFYFDKGLSFLSKQRLV